MTLTLRQTQGTLPAACDPGESGAQPAPQTLLACDTSLGSVVAVNSGNTVYEVASADPLGHAEAIGELIAAALQAAGIRPAQLTGVVMGVGPGPFTGLRVGMAAATAFATALQLPLLPVLSHEAAALAAMHDGTRAPGSVLRVTQDARRKELFISDYRLAPTGQLPELVAGPTVVPRAGYVSAHPEHTPEAVSGAALIAAALVRLRHGIDFVNPDARYLRDPDVRPPAGVKPVVA